MSIKSGSKDNTIMERLMAEFLNYCVSQKRLSANTLRAYECDLRYFIKYLSGLESPISDPCQIERHIMEDYLAELNTKLKVKTVKRKFAAFSAFFSYLEYQELIQTSPLAKFRLRLRDNPTLPNTVSIGDVEKILSTVYNRSADSALAQRTKLRDIAIIELLFSCGMRVSELSGLTLSDYNTSKGSLRILGKGSKERSAYITDESALAAFENWLSMRRNIQTDSPYIFINRYNDYLNPMSIRWMIHKYADMAGIDTRVTPHSFRHSFASSLLNEDVDSKYIQELLGHSSINTTQLYLHTTEEKKMALLKKSHPRQNMHITNDFDHSEK